MNNLPINNRAIVIVAGRNVSDTVETCLDTILSQDYPDLGIVFIDDCSTDDTLSKVRNKLTGDNIVIIPLENPSGRLMCWKQAVKSCSGSCVIFLVNPEDRLTDNGAVSAMMRHHIDYDVVWSQYVLGNHIGSNSALTERVREDKWTASHLMSFKKFLFNGVDTSYFADKMGKPFEFAEEIAVMLPITEIAGKERCYFLDRIFYRCGGGDKSREYLTRRALCETQIRNKRPYGLWQSTTFIVPYCNHHDTLEGGVQHLIEQTVLTKIFLVNTKSTDNTQEVCEKLVKRFPTIVYHISQEHDNVPAAKNAGARMAKSNFILPFTIGDYITYGWLASCYFAMSRHVDIVHTPYGDTSGRIINDSIVDDLANRELFQGTAVIRRSVWEKVGDWLEIPDEKASNLDFWLRCNQKGCFFIRTNCYPVIVPDLAKIK